MRHRNWMIPLLSGLVLVVFAYAKYDSYVHAQRREQAAKAAAATWPRLVSVPLGDCAATDWRGTTRLHFAKLEVSLPCAATHGPPAYQQQDGSYSFVTVAFAYADGRGLFMPAPGENVGAHHFGFEVRIVQPALHDQAERKSLDRSGALPARDGMLLVPLKTVSQKLPVTALVVPRPDVNDFVVTCSVDVDFMRKAANSSVDELDGQDCQFGFWPTRDIHVSGRTYGMGAYFLRDLPIAADEIIRTFQDFGFVERSQ